METTFYDEHATDQSPAKDGQVKMLKRTMTLDFNANQSKKQKFQQLLQSPDMHLLKLASPELEKMIIQQNGMVTTTPTPTQFIYPKFVTEEQEAYAQGFVAALAELHGGKASDSGDESGDSSDAGDQDTDMNNMLMPPSSATYTTLSTTTSLPGSSVITHTQNHHQLPTGFNPHLTHLKEEPQTVPCMSSTPPPMSPINMESQERFKLERKRARNRVAARKCRTRKLERISRLEDKVKDLKGQNNELTSTAQSLREQVFQLKQNIVEHVNSGCQIMLGQNVQI